MGLAEKNESDNFRGNDRYCDPKYGYRYSFKEIAATYKTAKGAFEKGNFILAVELSDPNSELHAMSLVLSGVVDRGVRLLAGLANLSDLATTVLAFGNWYLNRPGVALDLLSQISQENSLAAELSKLIRKKKIIVYQISRAPTAVESSRTAEQLGLEFESVGQFDVLNVATQAIADGAVSTDFTKMLETIPKNGRPNFIFAPISHWFMPEGIDNLDIPLVVWGHDQDHFVHRNYDNYRIFDLQIVVTSQEHFEISRSLGCFAATNMLSDPYNATYEDTADVVVEKDIDIFFSSTGFDKFLSEKSRFLQIISTLSEKYKLLFVDGRLPYDEYLDLMKRTKFVPVVSRVCGNPSPRWREALASGSFLLYPENTMYDKITKGCFSYGEENFANSIKSHLDNYLTGTSGLKLHKTTLDQIDKDFKPYRRSEELQKEGTLRYISFTLLLKQELNWKLDDFSDMAKPRRRLTWLSSTLSAHFFGHSNVVAKALDAAYKFDETTHECEKDINNKALTLVDAGLTSFGGTIDPETREHAAKVVEEGFDLLSRGLVKFPESLLLRFNKIAWTCVKSNALSQQLSDELINELIRLHKDFESLSFDVRNSDVAVQNHLSYDPVFPHYSYGQNAIKYLVEQTNPQLAVVRNAVPPKDILRSASLGYWGLYLEKNGDLSGALQKYDAALEIYSDNLPLCEKRFLCALELLEDNALGEQINAKIIDYFFDLSDLYPVCLLTDFHRVLSVADQLGRHGQCERLVHDWYRLARCLHRDTVQKYLTAEQLSTLSAYSQYWPVSLSEIMSKNGENCANLVTDVDLILAEHFKLKLKPEQKKVANEFKQERLVTLKATSSLKFKLEKALRKFYKSDFSNAVRPYYHRLIPSSARWFIRHFILVKIKNWVKRKVSG